MELLLLGHELLDQIRSNLPVSTIVSKWVALKRRGREYIGLSPFKKEKTPSFTVNDEKGFYHCFSSGEHGDIFSFVMKMEGLTFPEAVEKLAKQAGIVISYRKRDTSSHQDEWYAALNQAAQIFSRSMTNDVFNYLSQRGLSKESVDIFLLGFCNIHALKNMKDFSRSILETIGLIRNGYFLFQNRLVFPIHDEYARIVGFGARKITFKDHPDNFSFGGKYINTPDTPLFHKGQILYNFFRAKQYRNTTLLIVEGYMDVISLYQYGFPCSVAALGTSLTEKQIRLAWKIFDDFCICFDGDDSGAQAAYRTALRILSILPIGKTAHFIFLPIGEDPDSLLRKKGADSLRTLLMNKKTLLDVVWLFLTRQVVETPEEKALLEREIDNICQIIKEPLLKKHYRFSLRDRLWKYFHTSNKRHACSTFRIEEPNLALKQQQVILATLYNHSALIPDFLEDVMHIDWCESLRPLVSELIHNGCIACPPSFITQEIYQLAFQAHPSSTLDEARIFLKHAFTLYQRSLSFR